MPGDERSEQLLAVARALVDRDGPGALTMERVAEQAAVSKPMVYRHFANRTELVTAMLQQSWRQVDRAVAERVGAAPAGAERIRASFAAFLDETAQQSTGFRALANSVSSDPGIEAARQGRSAAQESRWAAGFQQHFALPPETAGAAAAVLHGALAGAVVHAGRSEECRRQAEDVFVTAIFATLSALASRRGGQP